MARRSLYMRLYISWWNDDQCYPTAAISEAEAEQLFSMGHISPVYRGERLLGWQLTEAGLREWAAMNENDLKSRTGDFLITESGHPLRYLVGLMTWDEMCERAQEKMQKLTQPQQKVLALLAGGEVTKLPQTVTGKPIRALTDKGMVKKIDVGKYQITPEGEAALNELPSSPVAEPDDDGRARDRDTTDNCDDCVHKRVLDLLMESLPEARELYKLLQRQEEVLAKLKGRKGRVGDLT